MAASVKVGVYASGQKLLLTLTPRTARHANRTITSDRQRAPVVSCGSVPIEVVGLDELLGEGGCLFRIDRRAQTLGVGQFNVQPGHDALDDKLVCSG